MGLYRVVHVMKWIFHKPDRKPLADSKRRFHYEALEPRWHSQSKYTFVEVDNVFGEAGEFNWSTVKEYRILDWRAGTHLHAANICEAMEDNINAQAWVDAEKKPSWWREIIFWKPEWIDRRLAGEDVAAELNAKLLDKLQHLFYPVDDIDVDDAIGYNDVVFEREHRRNQLKRSEG